MLKIVFIVIVALLEIAAIVEIIRNFGVRSIIKLILINAIIVLSYFLYESIAKPIRFGKEKEMRESHVIHRLKQIRKAQLAYKEKYDEFADDFDELIQSMKRDSFDVVKQIGSVPEELVDSFQSVLKAETYALEEGLIRRDTVRISFKDSLFSQKTVIDSMQYIPFTDKKQFELGAKELETGSRVKVQVFEAKAPYDVILGDLKAEYKQEINNVKASKRAINDYEGVKVGSLNEATNHAGNWE